MKGVNKIFKVDFKYNFKLNIHSGILEYLAGYEAGEIWELRGLTGHKKNNRFQEELNLRKKMKKMYKNDEKFKNKLLILLMKPVIYLKLF